MDETRNQFYNSQPRRFNQLWHKMVSCATLARTTLGTRYHLGPHPNRMNGHWRKSATIIVIVIMALLLPTLAVLQYRWLSQLSERERGYLRANMRGMAFRFSQDLDNELTGVFAAFFTPPPAAEAKPPASSEDKLPDYAARYERWQAEAEHPQLVGEVYVLRADARPALWQLQTTEKKFAPCEWPASLAGLRAQLEASAAQPRSEFADELRNRPLLTLNDERLAFIQRVMLPPRRTGSGQVTLLPPAGYFIVTLSLPVIQQRVLPALAQQHFGSVESFNGTIVTQTPEHKLVYQLGAPPESQAEPDVTTDLLGLRRQEFRRIFNSRAPDDAPRGMRNINDEQRLWQLRLSYRAGSLNAIVGSVRRRNLAVNFGILALLAASVGLLLLSARRAQRLAGQQMDFVANVSHELRTPLAVIKSAAWSLQRGVAREPEQIKQYSGLIGKESDRLIEMIEQILEFAGADRRKYELQPTRVSGLIENVIAAAQPLIDEGGYEFELNIAPHLPDIAADQAALTRALRNLIDNAMKYGGDARWLSVTAQSHQNEIQITVRDHGLGIPATELKDIFEPFWRGSEATSAQIRGNGLGLNLVRTIAQAHGGRVSVESKVGQGSAFTLHLPALTEPLIQPAAAVVTTSH